MSKLVMCKATTCVNILFYVPSFFIALCVPGWLLLFFTFPFIIQCDAVEKWMGLVLALA